MINARTLATAIAVSGLAALCVLATPGASAQKKAHPTKAVAAKAAKPGGSAEGKAVYSESHCDSCHAIGGKGGKMGPDLSHEGKKHDAKWLAEKITNPKKLNPKSTMPPTKLAAAKLKALSAYLASLK